MSSDLIAALDNALARVGEDIILRRLFGILPNHTAADVKCRAKVTAISADQTVAGIPATTFEIIISPTQIKAAQWPGPRPQQTPPFDVDQSIPRAGTTDKVLMRGLPPKDVIFVDPVMPDGEVVRINMKVKG
jgi:hypothetical protein